MSIIFVDKTNRNKLSEGRNYGFSSGFAKVTKKKNDTIVTMVMPITACGDFLNEVVHTEATGRIWDVYGFNYKPKNLFKRTKFAHLACSVVKYPNGQSYNGFEKDFAALEKNWQNIQIFLNKMEEKLGIKNKTTITRIAENLYLFSFDLFWVQGTYRISLYKLLSRMILNYDGTKDPIDYLNSMTTNERYSWNSIKNKVMDMVGGFIPDQNMKATDSCPHSVGIVGYQWPKKG